MSLRQNLSKRIRLGEPIPFPLSAALYALTPIVRVGMWRRLNKRVHTVGARVVSFGNITAGGTGKTPAVIERAQREAAEGRRPGILMRGYGAAPRKGIAVSTEADPKDHSETLGDEGALIASKAPEAVVFCSPNRVAAAGLAHREYGCEVLILDDGYQYTMLGRDENVLMIDAANPFGNGALLPRGPLREPLTAIARADTVVLTRCDQAADLEGLLETLARYNPRAPIRKTVHCPVGLIRLSDGVHRSLDTLRGQAITAACAIGSPEAFLRTLTSLGAVIDGTCVLPDHAPLPTGDLPRTQPVVVTEKDAIRMKQPGNNILALSIELKDFEA